jgi:hypothetical protein
VAEGLERPLSSLLWLASAAKTVVRREAHLRWERQWESTKASAPTKRSLRVYNGLRKAHPSVLTQMRTGRIGLNHFYKIGLRGSDWCGCDEGFQTPKHIALQCGLLSDLRGEMWRRIDRVGLKRREDFGTLVNEPKVAQYVADFMIKAGQPGQFQAVVPLQEDPGPGPSNIDIG